jgi:hypothetical protein
MILLRVRRFWRIRRRYGVEILGLAAITLVAIACSSFVGPYHAKIGKLHSGMSRDDVVEALGEPYGDLDGTPVYYKKGSGTLLAVLFSGSFSLCAGNSHGTCGWVLLEVPSAGPPKTFWNYKVKERSDASVAGGVVAIGGTVWIACRICDAAEEGALEKVEALLKGNPDLVFSKDNRGDTPLTLAARGGHARVAELLLANKADVNARDDAGWTPLLWAASGGYKDVAELLLINKADVNAKNTAGQTPLQRAKLFHYEDVAELLRQYGGQD